MGVAGCGKTTVGRLLARRARCAFLDADDHHPRDNIAKMRRGIPLTDRDRAPWLTALRRLVVAQARKGIPTVLACSALRERYRRRLCPSPGSMRFAHLVVTPALAARRLRRRRDHYFRASLVESQFAALERPRSALALRASLPAARLAEQLERWWGRGAPLPAPKHRARRAAST